MREVNALTLKQRFFCSHKCTFIYRLPIDFFYFEDFQWSFFSKIIRQKQRMPWPRMKRIKTRSSSIEGSLLYNQGNKRSKIVFPNKPPFINERAVMNLWIHSPRAVKPFSMFQKAVPLPLVSDRPSKYAMGHRTEHGEHKWFLRQLAWHPKHLVWTRHCHPPHQS